jgi:replicative superfamily II helicase
MGFKGMKQLNLVQTIVFETAYKKSENMLICAPTGAGKTNVALLTVLSLIRQFSTISQSGQVHVSKEMFKVSFACPVNDSLLYEVTFFTSNNA